MYILQKDNQTFYGPNLWNPKLIQSYIYDDFELEVTVPQVAPESGSDIGNEIFAYKVNRTEVPNHNTKIQKTHGPFYTIENNEAVVSYEIIDRTLDEVKQELLAQVADNRWKKEVSGATVTIQGYPLKVTTSRGERDIYLQALQNVLDNQTWKLQTIENVTVWLTLSLSDLQLIVNAIIAHIQSAFDWEKTISMAIANSSTLAELDAIDTVAP